MGVGGLLGGGSGGGGLFGAPASSMAGGFSINMGSGGDSFSQVQFGEDAFVKNLRDDPAKNQHANVTAASLAPKNGP